MLTFLRSLRTTASEGAVVTVQSAAAISQLSPGVWHVPQLGGGSVEVSVRFTVDPVALGWDDNDRALGVAGLVGGVPVVAVYAAGRDTSASRSPFVHTDAFEVEWPDGQNLLQFTFSMLGAGLVAVVSPLGIHALVAVGDRLANFESATFGTIYDNRFVPLYNDEDERVWMFGMLEEPLQVSAAFSSSAVMSQSVEYQPMPTWRSPQLVDLGVWHGGGEQSIFVDWGYNVQFIEL